MLENVTSYFILIIFLNVEYFYLKFLLKNSNINYKFNEKENPIINLN